MQRDCTRSSVTALYAASLDGHLRAAVPQVQAVYRALAAPGVYQELVEESGWSSEEFERWVGDTLERYATGGQAADG
jgi:hypothetical protein